MIRPPSWLEAVAFYALLLLCQASSSLAQEASSIQSSVVQPPPVSLPVTPLCPSGCRIGLGVSTAINTAPNVILAGNVTSIGTVGSTLFLTAYVSYSTLVGNAYPCIVSTGPQMSLSSAMTKVIPSPVPELFHAQAESQFLSTLSLGGCSVEDEGFYFPTRTTGPGSALATTVGDGSTPEATGNTSSTPNQGLQGQQGQQGQSTGLSQNAKLGLGIGLAAAISLFTLAGFFFFRRRNMAKVRGDIVEAKVDDSDADSWRMGFGGKAELESPGRSEIDSKDVTISKEHELVNTEVYELDAQEWPQEMETKEVTKEIGIAR